jgi:hypothetical protein
VSEVELVLVGSEREVGPIAFVRRAQHALALRWTDAPVGTRVDATALSTRGAEPLGRWTLADAAGERQLALDGPCVLNLALRDASGSEVLRQFDCDPLRDPVLAVDLCAARAVRVVLDVAAEPRRGAEQLVLFGTHARAGEHPVRASLQLVDGAAPSPAPLPPGDYFFRLIAPSAECVLGLARIDATSAVGELAVAWRGTRRRLEDAEQSAGASVVVESVGGRSLDFVPAELRTLRLPDAGADERVLCPDVLTYRAYRR